MAFVVAMGLMPNLGHAETNFLAADEAFKLKVEKPGQSGDPIMLQWTIAPGYYLYRERMEVTARPAGAAIEVERPAGERKEDPNFGVMDVYHDQVAITVRSATAGSMTVSWQGCAEEGLCIRRKPDRWR